MKTTIDLELVISLAADEQNAEAVRRGFAGFERICKFRERYRQFGGLDISGLALHDFEWPTDFE
jgi:hypothetical protein